MAKSTFLKLSPSEKIAYLKKNAPASVDMLNKDIATLSSSELDLLYNINTQNNVSSIVAEVFVDELKKFAATAPSMFSKAINSETKDVKDVAMNIFNQTIVACAKRVSDDLYDGLKKKEGILFNGLLATGAVRVLEGILDFRKKIDAKVPGLSGKIIDLSAGIITTLVAVYYPPAGIILKTTGLLDKAKDFISYETLEGTIGGLKEKIGEIEKEKKLAEIYKNALEVGEKIALLSESAGVSQKAVKNLGLTKEQMQDMSIAAKEKPATKAFLQEVCKVTEQTKLTPKDATDNIDNLKKDIIKSIEQQSISREMKDLLTKKIETAFKNTSEELAGKLSSDARILEKVAFQQEARADIAKVLKTMQTELTKLPNGHSVADNLTKHTQKLLDEKLPPLDSKLMKAAKDSPIIAKELGLNLKTELALKVHSQSQRQS